MGVAPSSSVEGLGLGVWGFAKVPQTSALITVPGVVALIFVSVYSRGVIAQENAASALLYHDLTRCALIGANGCKMNRGAGRQRAARSRRLRASSRARNTLSADRPASGPCIPGHSWHSADHAHPFRATVSGLLYRAPRKQSIYRGTSLTRKRFLLGSYRGLCIVLGGS